MQPIVHVYKNTIFLKKNKGSFNPILTKSFFSNTEKFKIMLEREVRGSIMNLGNWCQINSWVEVNMEIKLTIHLKH